MMAYFDALGAMCDRILPAFAAALDMPSDFFAPYFANEAHANLRFLHYPPQDAGEENLFGQAPHTDNSFMTALARTDVPGLAVRLPSGEWFPPPIIPGTFLINLGNIMRRWSNDRFLSTPHGVFNDSGTDRYSIAYFHSPNPDSVIECLPSCVSPTTRRATSRPSTATSCSNSTGPTISTRRATARTRRRRCGRPNSEAARDRFASLAMTPIRNVIARSVATKQSRPTGGDHAMFDLDRFIEDCRDAVRQDPSHKAAREVLARANSEPAAILAALGEPTRAGVDAALQVGQCDDPQRRLGQADDDHAARPPDVGRDRRLYRARGQHLLAPRAGCAGRADRGGRRQIAGRRAAPSRWGAT